MAEILEGEGAVNEPHDNHRTLEDFGRTLDQVRAILQRILEIALGTHKAEGIAKTVLATDSDAKAKGQIGIGGEVPPGSVGKERQSALGPVSTPVGEHGDQAHATYTIQDVAARCKVSISSIERAERTGAFPRRLAAFGRRRLWSVTVVERFLAQPSASYRRLR